MSTCPRKKKDKRFALKARLQASRLNQEARSQRTYLQDMRRYLRDLVRRDNVASEAQFEIVHSTRRPWALKRDIDEITRVMCLAAPDGWTVTKVDDLQGGGPGWLFKRMVVDDSIVEHAC